MYTKIRQCLVLAIDFFDEFGLERLTEPEKPLNEINSDWLLLKKGYNLTPAPQDYKYCM